MNVILNIALQEVRDGLRNRWIIALTGTLLIFALSLTFLGSTPGGTVGASPLLVTLVSLSSLSVFLLPLIGLVLSYDSVVGDMERGTLLLLLSYPVTRLQILLGKFLGHTVILAFATVVGYGAAGLIVARHGAEAATWGAFAAMIVSSVALGAAFSALGFCISTIVRERATAGGIAVATWLFFVLIYDMGLLAALVEFGNGIAGIVLNVLLLANPADTFRLLNLGGFDDVAALSGATGLLATVNIPVWLLGAGQLLWVCAPLSVAAIVFSRKEI